MKKFLIAAFDITLFQVLLVLSLSGLKYLMTSSGLAERLRLPLILIAIAAFIYLLVATGISGYLENQGFTVETWVLAHPNSKIRILIARFIRAGQLLPIAVGYSVFLYIAMPTSLTLFIAFFLGIILGNVINYLEKNKRAV